MSEPPREQIDRLIALYDRGELEEARRHGEALAQNFPDAPFIAYLLGAVNAAAGRLEDAAVSYRQALRLNPQSAVTHFNLAGVLDRLGRTREAVASYTQALKIKPDAKAYCNLGACLQDLGMPEAAAASYRKALEIDPGLAEAHNNLGHALDRMRQSADAVVSCRNALRIRPDYAEAQVNLGNALMHLGQSEEAAASYEAALAIRPDYAQAHRSLSALKTYRPDDPQLGRMLKLIGQPGLPDEDRMQLGFALGKACADIGRHDEAFSYLANANRLRRQALAHEMSTARETFAKIRSIFADDLPQSSGIEASAGTESAGAEAERVVFILGMPRSGTTLVEQILASHSRVHGAGELKLLDQAVQAIEWDSAPLTAERLRSLGESYLSGLGSIGAPEPYITDKMPFNFLWIGFIFAALPQAKVVHVRRDARATCWSNFRHFFPDKGMGFTCDLEDLAEYYRMYSNLMNFWHERFPARIYDLSYEALTENQEAETRKLLDYVGLDWEPECLAFYETERAVNTASATQVRQRMYRGTSEEWRRYRRHIETMIESLEGL